MMNIYINMMRYIKKNKMNMLIYKHIGNSLIFSFIRFNNPPMPSQIWLIFLTETNN